MSMNLVLIIYPVHLCSIFNDRSPGSLDICTSVFKGQKLGQGGRAVHGGSTQEPWKRTSDDWHLQEWGRNPRLAGRVSLSRVSCAQGMSCWLKLCLLSGYFRARVIYWFRKLYSWLKSPRAVCGISVNSCFEDTFMVPPLYSHFYIELAFMHSFTPQTFTEDLLHARCFRNSDKNPHLHGTVRRMLGANCNGERMQRE